MTTKVTLPVWQGSLPPTAEAMREQLGGRAAPDAFVRAGRAVFLPDGASGVVLVSEQVHDLVWTADREVRRVARTELSPLVADLAADLAARIGTVRTFAQLTEGGPVRYRTREGAWEVGQLVEKCRFGALVVRPDGVVLGLGFASLQAADEALH